MNAIGGRLLNPLELTCATHGGFLSWVGTSFECPQCNDARERPLREAAQRAERAQQAHARRERRLDMANLRGRFRASSFDDFNAITDAQRSVLQACRNFAETFTADDGGGLWLIGGVGTGKTFLGAAMTIAALDRGMSAALMTARELVRELRSTWAKDAPNTESELIEEFGGLALLVLDEAGVGFGTDSEQVQLLDVLDLRYQLNRPTVLLSNLNKPALKAALGERAFDRLHDGSRTLVLDWSSHRKPLKPAP